MRTLKFFFHILYWGGNMYQIYMVESNDTLDQIANKFGTTVSILREINGLEDIYPGSYIIVPNNNSNLYDYYIVKQGDNIYAIARQYGVSYDTLLKINGLNPDDYIYPNQQILIPKPGSGVYVTKETDTIQSLYNMYGNRWDEFLTQNKDVYVMPDQMISFK